MFRLFKNLFPAPVDFSLLMQKGAVIVDVRSPSEFASGHINGSKNIPLDEFQRRMTELKKAGKPVITVCRSGNRSSVAKSMLTSKGIEAYNGGAWHSLDKKLHRS
jgi:rhodanese-related sulfurtransferase